MEAKNNIWVRITANKVDCDKYSKKTQKKLTFILEVALSLAVYNIIHTILYIPYSENINLILPRLVGLLGYFTTYYMITNFKPKIGKIVFLFATNFMMAFLKITVAGAIPLYYFQVLIVCLPFLLFDWEEKAAIFFSILITFLFLIFYHFFAEDYQKLYSFPKWLINYNTFSLLLLVISLFWFFFKLLSSTIHQIEKDLIFKSFTLDHATLGVIWVNYDGNIIYANDKLVQLLGYEQWKATNVKETKFDFDEKKWERIWATTNEKKEFIIDKKIKHLDGSVVVLNIRGNIVNYKGKKIFCGYIKDSTRETINLELEKAELQLVKDLNFDISFKEAIASYILFLEEVVATQKIKIGIKVINESKTKLIPLVEPSFEDTEEVWLYDVDSLHSIVVQTRSPIIIDDIRNNQYKKEIKAPSHFVKLQIGPIISSQGEVLGTISSYHTSIFNNTERSKFFEEKITKTLSTILERNTNQKTLKIQQEEIRAIINAVPDLIIKYSVDGEYLFVKPAAEQFSKLRTAKVGTYIHDFFNEENTKLLIDAIHRTLEKEAVQTIHYNINNGEYLEYFEAYLVPNGKDCVISFIRDVTDKVISHLTIEKNITEMRAVLDSVPDIILKMSKEGKYLAFKNDNTGDIKYAEEDLVGHKFDAFFPDHLIEIFRVALEKTLSTQKIESFDCEILKKDKSIINYEVRIVPNGYDEAICFVRNITEKVNSQKVIDQNHKETDALVEAVPDTILKFDQKGTLLFCMAENKNDFHSIPQELIGRNINVLLDVELGKFLLQNIQRTLKKPQLNTLEYERTNEEGARENYEYRIVPSKEDEVILFVRDISESIKIRRQLKTAMQEAREAVKAKSQFLSNMSHEIRTPMNVIMGLTKILLQSNLNDQQRENLKAVKFSSENLLTIINDILDLSKIDAEKITFEEKSFNLKKFLKDFRLTFLLMAKDKNFDFDIILDKNLPNHVKGDKVRLNQILTNLTGNAFKFTNKGSVMIHVSTIYKDDSKIQLKFEIIDTGIGIPEDDQASIFEQFTQSLTNNKQKIKGTGLGLTISKKLVELQGGSIGLESKVGEGSKFFFDITLAISKAEIISNEEEKEISFESIKGINILLAEDNTLNQFLAKQIFAEWHVLLDIANDGLEAIEMIAQKDYHIVLMDLQMPQLDGFQATEHIRTKLPHPKSKTPIVALTADAFPETRQKALDIGMDDFIAKPFCQVDLFDVIRRNIFKNGDSQETIIPIKNKTTAISKENPSVKVDLSILLDMIGNQKEAIEKIFSLFKTDTKKDVMEMLQGLKCKDLVVVANTSHKLKSAFKTFGIHDGYEILLKIQSISKKGVYDAKLEKLIPKIVKIYTLQCEAIQTHIHKML